MNEYKLREATTEWLDKQSFDLFITLNTEVELTKQNNISGKMNIKAFFILYFLTH